MNENKLKSVLITGTSSGMGKATVQHLSENGFFVYAGVRKEEDKKIWNGMENVLPVLVDVTDQDMISAIYDQISPDQNFFGIVNNAAIIFVTSLLEVSKADLIKIFDVNLFGPICIINKFYPLLRKNNGRIVNISSINGFVPATADGGYSMTKHAMEAYTEQVIREFEDVKISVIQPGLFKTAMVDKAILQLQNKMMNADEDTRHRMQQTINYFNNEERLKDPKQIAKTVLHIFTTAKPKIRYVVGAEYEEQWIIDSLVSRLVGVNKTFKTPRTENQIIENLRSIEEKMNGHDR